MVVRGKPRDIPHINKGDRYIYRGKSPIKVFTIGKSNTPN